VTEASTRRALAEIAHQIGREKISTAPEMLVCYAFDATNIRSRALAVAFPTRTEDVRAIMSVASDAGLATIPRGAGTGFAGGTVPVQGGIVISTEKLDRIISIDREERVAKVQAGVVNAALQREAAKVGLMFPPDPSSLEVATIGGNIAQDAGGPRALKYGVTRDYVLAAELVTREGMVIESRSKARAVPCWDPVTTLVVSSEGTLGTITEARLTLLDRPTSFVTALAFFRTTVDAAAAVSRVLESGIVPAAVELMDAQTVECVRAFVDMRIPANVGCSLLVETDGCNGEAEAAMAVAEKALRGAGAVELRSASSDSERDDLWKMRRSISPSLARIAPCKLNEDVCVPRSRLPELVRRVDLLAQKYRLNVPTFGHAGDGNLHVNVMIDRTRKDEVRRAEALVEELFEATLELEGSVSGEHGIGITKLQFLRDQLGPAGCDIQKRIKLAFDPCSTVNPGKVIGQS
jgi:glycolate oxidase